MIEEVTMPATFADAMQTASRNIWTKEAKERLTQIAQELAAEQLKPEYLEKNPEAYKGFYGPAMKKFWEDPETRAEARAAYVDAGVTNPAVETPPMALQEALEASIARTKAAEDEEPNEENTQPDTPTGTVTE
jgi:hypothetical protein